MSTRPTQHRPVTERRHTPRRFVDGMHVHLNVPGVRTQRCKVRCISGHGIFIDPVTALQPALPVELAFTIQYTRQLVKVYRHSAYVARVSDNGAALLYFDNRKFRSTS
jgi:hypothetical protein